jgi:uncharacterized protein (TIGR00251 family)
LPPFSTDSPLSSVAGGLRLRVRLTPRAGAERIDGIANGVLKVAVKAPPAENQANEALLRLLASAWRMPRRDLQIVGGNKSRSKTVHIAGEPTLLLKRIGDALAALPEA